MENRDQVDASPSHGAALASEHLSRVVGEKALVNEISVEVQVGEVLAVVGHSGSGKTSFLRLLNRLDEPTGGIVRFHGRDYRELAPGAAGAAATDRHGHAGCISFSRHRGWQRRVRAASTRATADCRADCLAPSACGLAWISGTRREQPLRRRGSTRIDSPYLGERSGNPPPG